MRRNPEWKMSAEPTWVPRQVPRGRDLNIKIGEIQQMKIGKLPETVLERSVIRQTGHRRPEVLAGPGIGIDCSAIQVNDAEILVFSTDPITGTGSNVGSLAIHVTANDLAASGADPVAVMLTALLPETIEEPQIRAIVQDAEAVCRELNMEIIGGHTEVTCAVREPLLSVTGIGKIPAGMKLLSPADIQPGDALVLTKWIALEGTAILAVDHVEKLKTRLPEDLIHTAAGFIQYLSVVPDARTAREAGARAMHDVTEGGVFGALWEMAEAAGCGLEVDVKAIPIRQETVEVCEFFDVNPYQLMSSGSMLIAAKDGTLMTDALQAAGIPAVVIGRMTAGTDRILRNGEEVRYLDRPKTDELYRV